MGGAHYEKQITEALKNGEFDKAAWLCNDWQKDGGNVLQKPIYFLTMANAFAKRGDMEGVRFNIGKLIELLEHHQ